MSTKTISRSKFHAPALPCPLTDQQVVALDKALVAIREEVFRAARKHGGRPFSSPHEGYGVLLEEVDEVWDEVKANNLPATIAEMVQVGAMAAFFLTSFAGAAEKRLQSTTP